MDPYELSVLMLLFVPIMYCGSEEEEKFSVGTAVTLDFVIQILDQ